MMKLALISDIHGNLTALNAVLDQLKSEAPDKIVCLGDTAIFGPQPKQVLDRLYELKCPVVMGNTDAWALKPMSHPVTDEESGFFNDIELWGANQLDFAYPGFIRHFWATVEVDMENGMKLLCYHGSPLSYDDPIDPDTPDEVLDGYFAGTQAQILAGGHTHVQFMRQYGDRTLLNPGSVGLPFHTRPDGSGDFNPAWAEYALITWEGTDVSIDLRRVPYDLEVLRSAVHESGMPHGEWWLKDWEKVSG